MGQGDYIRLGYDTIFTALKVASPVILTVLVVGVAVGILQAVIQVHEMTLTFVPKIIAAIIVILITLPFSVRVMVDFTRRLFEMLPLIPK